MGRTSSIDADVHCPLEVVHSVGCSVIPIAQQKGRHTHADYAHAQNISS